LSPLISNYLRQILLLVKRLSVVYLVYFLCRLLFFAANKGYFPSVTTLQFVEDCIFGMRFDSFSIVIANALFILLSLLPFQFFYNKGYQKLLLWIFMVCNTIFMAFNCVDIGYYPFIKKRTTSEIFNQMGGQTDVIKLLPRFLVDFWWIFLSFVLFVFLIKTLYRRFAVPTVETPEKKTASEWTFVVLIFLLSAGIAVLGVRGGFQRIPLDLVNAGSMTRPAEVPIVLNTPFSIIKSFNQKSLPDYDFYSASELVKVYSPLHHFKDSTFRKLNVVVLILESFSKEYTRLSGRKSVTPFLDSLMNEGLVCTNGFSNGTKSIEGIPAILSGLPSLMSNPFINSMYANNDQTSFAWLLGREGYTTAFFHGGINGTMNFDDWAALAGYGKYYGRNEYDNDKDFDNYWGIWDEPFLQFAGKRMDQMKEPFHTAIFSLSSHHPYFIPDKYKGKFPVTNLENSESIGYADHSVRMFFELVKKSPWYTNTLFVLVADHAGISEDPFYSNLVGNACIPIVFYRPGRALRGEHKRVFSQIDILPSVLQQLGYNKPFFAFGRSYLEERHGNDYFFNGSTHYLYGDSTVYFFDMPDIRQAYNYRRDSLLYDNITGRFPALDSLNLRRYHAFVQTYNHTLIHNAGRINN
jgi:phosphoglycerol transferase MdoB-like AlkP superfamily enzyme